MITIRVVAKGDADCISQTLVLSISDLCSVDHRDDPRLIAQWTANKTPENITRWIENPRITLFIAEIEGDCAGVGGVSADGEVILNYVAPEHRFCGVSSSLLAIMETELSKLGIGEGKLTSTETAYRFYRDAGWADGGAPDTETGLIGYPMKKQLEPIP